MAEVGSVLGDIRGARQAVRGRAHSFPGFWHAEMPLCPLAPVAPVLQKRLRLSPGFSVECD